MAPLPPENTRRLWVEYFDGVNNHELMLRGRTDATAADLMGVVDGFFTELTAVLYELTIVGARYAEAGSVISNPVAWTGAADYGTGEMPSVNAPREVAFEARSNDGRKVSYSFYGYLGATPANYRFEADEVASISAARAVLVDAADAGFLGTISGAKPIFKTYANFNFNSYWERRARG